MPFGMKIVILDLHTLLNPQLCLLLMVSDKLVISDHGLFKQL
jgi:hypothetical protein